MAERNSQTEILRQARQALQGSSYLPLRRVACDFSDGQLQLRGKVESFYLKQLAQSIVGMALAREVQLDNQLRVTAS